MGVESYFIRATLKKPTSFSELKNYFSSHDYDLKQQIVKYGIFKHKKYKESDLILNNLVLFSLYDRINISFSACFACYEQTAHLISSLLFELTNDNMLDYIYYGKEKVESKIITENNQILAFINQITASRLEYFQLNYTSESIDVLPKDFYRYWNKHCKELRIQTKK